MGRLRSGVGASASFRIFTLTAGGMSRWGEMLSGGTARGEYVRRNMSGGNGEYVQGEYLQLKTDMCGRCL